ncbi:MAG: twin-arginine translocase TatA/TatE family subunit [Flavobacteriales bacterium]|jgi:sec-independent protein translocase protein TatA|nr:twin-arginine translocase TatA/TatE family subunit [Flavobacteriales bacterium]
MNSTLLFLNLGGGEIIVVLLVVLLFFGSNKIPELARGLGRGMREFKDATSGVQREIEESMKEAPKKTIPKITPNADAKPREDQETL